ncbi:unnamed protein product [Lactuca virosa]|uniref:Aminotransferase-like plant mobile domain-containing protein n=1 Tax=Lactuca virosa TaxID=75947 RepID=A0AAU9LRM3_9ASTR|nr:unnamed protein product [Lactuca virosa]
MIRLTGVFQSAAISPREKSKRLDVEFDLFRTNLVLTKEEFAISLDLSDDSCQPKTFATPSSPQLLTMFKEMGYTFEENTEPNLSRIRKACLPTPWHFLSSVLTRCVFGSVGGHIRGKTDLWVFMYGLFDGINVDYTSILWEDFLTFLFASKNKFLIHHPRWWSIIIHDVINNRNLRPEGTPEGPQPQFLRMTPYRIHIASDFEFSHPIIIPYTILAKLDENNASLCSYQRYIQGTTSSPKNKNVLDKTRSPPKYGTTSNPFSFLDSSFQAPYDYDEPSSLTPVSPAGFQSVLESPSNRVSLDYDSLHDDDQDGEKKFELEDLPKSFPVQYNQDKDTPMQMVDIASSEGLIVDDEPHDMSIVLYSKPSTRTFNIDLDDYSPSPQKESQEHDDTQKVKFYSYPRDPSPDDGTPTDTNEANTSEPETERIRLTAQMVADGIAEILLHKSSHCDMHNFQGYLERMADNVCILNETTEAHMKKLQVTIKDFEGTTSYIKGQFIHNMRRIETIDHKIHNTIEDSLSTMHQKIENFIQSLSSLESVYESKLDHLQNHITSQDRYTSIVEKSIAELSKASTSTSTPPIQAFSEKVQRQLDSLQSDIANLSKSNSQKDNNLGEYPLFRKLFSC